MPGKEETKAVIEMITALTTTIALSVMMEDIVEIILKERELSIAKALKGVLREMISMSSGGTEEGDSCNFAPRTIFQLYICNEEEIDDAFLDDFFLIGIMWVFLCV